METKPTICFTEDTEILTANGYIPIKLLKNGDLIETYKMGQVPIWMISKINYSHYCSEERIRDQLYKYTKETCNDLFEDLIITGCHCVLVNSFSDEKEKLDVKNLLGNIYVTNDKYRLPACIDKRSDIYETPGHYMVYHIALENDDYYANFGIYANGLLVESSSKRYLKEISGMTIIK